MSFLKELGNAVTTVGRVVKETYGPLSALDSPIAPSLYRYPLDVGDTRRYPHTVEFQTWVPTQVPISDMGVIQSTQDNVFKPIGNKVSSGVSGLLGGINKLRSSINDKLGIIEEVNVTSKKINLESIVSPTVVDMGSEMKVNRNQQFNDRMLDWTRRAQRSDMIAMYMPSGGWMDRVTNSYAQQSMTQALGTAGAILEVGSSVLKEYDGWGKEGGEGAWSKAYDMINGPAGMEALSKASAALGMDAGVVRDAGLNALGYALNPQFEMLYSGTDLREFQFDFTMTPRSQEEAETIRKIIQKFKYHASPAYVSGQGRYIVPPSYFDITFKFNGVDSEWLPQISTCVLKQFDVDYTGGLESWATHSDGSPIQVKMTMIFSELEMMHKSLRKMGY